MLTSYLPRHLGPLDLLLGRRRNSKSSKLSSEDSNTRLLLLPLLEGGRLNTEALLPYRKPSANSSSLLESLENNELERFFFLSLRPRDLLLLGLKCFGKCCFGARSINRGLRPWSSGSESESLVTIWMPSSWSSRWPRGPPSPR